MKILSTYKTAIPQILSLKMLGYMVASWSTVGKNLENMSLNVIFVA